MRESESFTVLLICTSRKEAYGKRENTEESCAGRHKKPRGIYSAQRRINYDHK